MTAAPCVKWLGASTPGEYVRGVVLAVFGERGAVRVIVADPVVRVLKVDARRIERADLLTYRGEPYPVKRCARAFKRMGRAHGITKGAARLLRALA